MQETRKNKSINPLIVVIALVIAIASIMYIVFSVSGGSELRISKKQIHESLNSKLPVKKELVAVNMQIHKIDVVKMDKNITLKFFVNFVRFKKVLGSGEFIVRGGLAYDKKDSCFKFYPSEIVTDDVVKKGFFAKIKNKVREGIEKIVIWYVDEYPIYTLSGDFKSGVHRIAMTGQTIENNEVVVNLSFLQFGLSVIMIIILLIVAFVAVSIFGLGPLLFEVVS
jgi:hypothetical protein